VDGYRFGEFRLDNDARQLLSHETPVRLSPKAFQLLHELLEAAPRALSKSELQESLWPGTFVVEANLPHLIAEIRMALDDTSRSPRFVRTVHGFGYAFQERIVRTSRDGRRPLVCLLRWDGGRATLTEGDYIVGRDPAADIVLDSNSVSRRHVRVRVHPARVTLEDLGSKNGSFIRNDRVGGTVTLADGDEIRIGMLTVSVRITTEAASTETAILDADRRA
jgi:DNA-binding winged helix-turn-helix (wHTH) protein